MGIPASRLNAMLLAVADTMDAHRDDLCALDGQIGDADHGIAMAGGFGAVREALSGLDSAAPSDVLNTAARAFLNAVGASSGPLYATAFLRAGMAVKGKEELADSDASALIAAMAEGIAHRGKAQIGDKTMLDAWQPAAEAAGSVAGAEFAQAFSIAADAAERAADETAQMEAKLGRAARLGARSVGHRDPGAVSAALMLRAMADAAQG